MRYYRHLGVRITRLLTDNGACYNSKVFDKACRRLGIKHRRTRAYRPQTNGKAERLIQTALREWAYARSYEGADQRAAHRPHWLHHYNWHPTPCQPQLPTPHPHPRLFREQPRGFTHLAHLAKSIERIYISVNLVFTLVVQELFKFFIPVG